MAATGEVSDAELALRLHQELNRLPQRRRCPIKNDGPSDSPSAAASPSGCPDPSETTFKKPRLEVGGEAQAGSPPGKGESSSSGQDEVPLARLGSRSKRRQRSPVAPDSAQVGWVKKSCSALSAPSNPALLQGTASGEHSQIEVELGSAPLDSEQEAAAKVRKTLAIYNHERLHQVNLEEERVKADGGVKRPDLKTLHVMAERKQILHAGEKVIGHFPGVKVGDSFYERAQLCALRLHTPTVAGIDTLVAAKSPFGESIATSIVLAGGYEDDVDNGETFIYTGAGGNNIRGNRRQGGDQALKGVNQALANSGRLGVPVRVFRGFDETSGNRKVRVFTYDGLYLCVDFWIQKGISGFDVVKFKMQRQDGQPPLSSQQVYFVGQRGSLPTTMKAADRPGLISTDISGGREPIPVCLVNDIDKEDGVGAPALEYIARMDHGQEEGPACGCTRPEDCLDPSKCACARRNDFGFPYVEGGRLQQTGQGVVYECGPSCGCGDHCPSRVVQKGVARRFEVFRTRNRGFGVRCWDFIQVGSFICEYTGQILTDAQAHECDDDSYLFNIDPITDGLVGEEIGAEANVPRLPQVEYSIDALRAGNVARFINHSCTPNAVVQSVLFDHHNPSLCHIALFAYDNIPPGREITYDYNYKVGTVIGGDNEEKVLDCLCGNKPPICKGRLY